MVIFIWACRQLATTFSKILEMKRRTFEKLHFESISRFFLHWWDILYLSGNLERISILSTKYLEKLSQSDFTDVNSGRADGGILCRMLFMEFHRRRGSSQWPWKLTCCSRSTKWILLYVDFCTLRQYRFRRKPEAMTMPYSYSNYFKGSIYWTVP